MSWLRFPPLLIAASLALTPAASAIIRRHDRDDAKYLALGAKYPAVTKLSGGTATLIAPQWLLTAGHVVGGLTPFDRSVEFAGKAYPIEAVATHPDWRPRGRLKSLDIALVKLAQPVTGVTPVALSDQRDEEGKAVVFVGAGMFGDGRTGPLGDDGKQRAATNTVAAAMDNWLTFTFDTPPDGTELEGISGPGDSGGPALVEHNGKTSIIGVSSANDDDGAAGPCRYASTEYYARVSTAADWIRKTMQSDLPPRELPGQVIDLKSAPWPDSLPGKLASAFFAAYARTSDQSVESMGDFERAHRAQSALNDRPVEERIEGWRTLRAEWGALTPARCVPGDDNDLFVLVYAEHERVWKSFRFILEPSDPHKLTGIAIASPVAAPD